MIDKSKCRFTIGQEIPIVNFHVHQEDGSEIVSVRNNFWMDCSVVGIDVRIIKCMEIHEVPDINHDEKEFGYIFEDQNTGFPVYNQYPMAFYGYNFKVGRNFYLITRDDKCNILSVDKYVSLFRYLDELLKTIWMLRTNIKRHTGKIRDGKFQVVDTILKLYLDLTNKYKEITGRMIVANTVKNEIVSGTSPYSWHTHDKH